MMTAHSVDNLATASRHYRVILGALLATCLAAGCVSDQPYDDFLPTSTETARKELGNEISMLKGPFDAEMLVALALRHDVTLALLREDLNIARAERRAAFQARDPELRISYTGQDESGEQWERVTPEYVPWIDPIPYMSDFVPAPGWTHTGVDGIWRTSGNSGWTYLPDQGVWRQDPDATTRWRTTHPSALWYVNSLNNQILGPGELPSSIRNVSHNSSDGRAFQAALRFFPPNPYAVKHRVSAADARILRAQALVRAQEWDLSYDIRKLVETAQYQQEEIASLDVLVLIQKQIVKILEERVEAGAASAMDAMRASWRHLQAVSDRDTAIDDRTTTLKDLVPLVGVSLSELTISPRNAAMPGFDPATADLNQLETTALKHRADLNALVWQMQAAKNDLAEARTAERPWFSHVQFSMGRTSRDGSVNPDVRWTDSFGNTITVQDPDQQGSESTRTDWGIEAGIVLPIFTRLTHQSAPLQAEYRRCQTEFSSTWRLVLSDVRSSLADARSSSGDLARYRRERLPEAERMKSMLKAMENNVDVAPDEVLNLRSAILEADRSYGKLEHRYRNAVLDVSKAIGRDISEIRTRQPPAREDRNPASGESPVLRNDLIDTLSR